MFKRNTHREEKSTSRNPRRHVVKRRSKLRDNPVRAYAPGPELRRMGKPIPPYPPTHPTSDLAAHHWLIRGSDAVAA